MGELKAQRKSTRRLNSGLVQMRQGWLLEWDCVELEERIAHGAEGEVWKGVLNGHYRISRSRSSSHPKDAPISDPTEVRVRPGAS